METQTHKKEIQKSYFDVLGLCCSSEVPLIEKILTSQEGIVTVSVIVPSRTVIVVHDSLIISQMQIVKALNQARLEATVRTYGQGKTVRNWPSPYTIASGALLALSFFSHVYYPMHWIALGAVAAGLPPMILRSIFAVRRLVLDINILMLIAVGGSIALRDYMDAGFIVFLFTISEWLESRASYKATAVMSSLMNLAPQKAIVAESGALVDTRDVKINTVLAVKAGEAIPIDGIVVEGRSEVDESSLTGESFPVAKQPQSLVWAGTINMNGYISVKTTALAEHSAVAKMTKLVEEAQNSKSRTQRLIDSCAKYYTPAVVVTAGALAAVPAAMRVHNLNHWFHLALVLLVSACPCALVLSTPVATFCALTKAAKAGLLVKGGDYLEALAKTRVVAFDKTGTLTRGEFAVMDFQSIDRHISMDTLLYWVSSIESKSSHPMAAALTDYAWSHSIDPKPENVQEFRVFPGEGIYGEIEGKCLYIGNQRIATRIGCNAVANVKELRGVSVGYIFSEAMPIGVFSLSDTCRTGVIEAIRKLKSLGMKTAMLTGDSNSAAMHVQNQLGNAIEMVHAELLPEDKVNIIKELKNKQGPTTMIGDGMNDAPALASADVGISMGISGSAVAMETSHIILMSNDVRKIPDAIQLARKTQRKIIENIILSVFTKVAILALAFSGHPLLWAAVLTDVGTCLIVILSSMLLLQTIKRKGKKCCASSNHSHAHGVDSFRRQDHCAEDHAEDKCGLAHPCHQLRQQCCSKISGECGVIKGIDEVISEGSFEKQDCHRNSIPALHDPNHSHNSSKCLIKHGGLDHSILIDTNAEHHDGSCGTSKNDSCNHEEELAAQGGCTHKDSIEMECGGGVDGHIAYGKQDWGSEASCFTTHVCRDLQLCRELRKRQIGVCCRSYRKECGKKHMCCGGRLPQLAEIITE